MAGLPFVPSTPGFVITPPATAFGTVVVSVIPPGPFDGHGVPFMVGPYAGGQGRPNWWTAGSVTHVTDLIVTCSTTANIIYLMRPLNWTTLGAAMAKNTTAITLTDDPGVFSTNYRYPLPNQTWTPPGTLNSGANAPDTSDNTIATNDFIAFQLANGRWHVSKIASGTFGGGNLVMSTATPNFASSTAVAGTPVFFFGIFSDTVPATALPHNIFTPIVSTQKMNLLAPWGGNASAVGGGGGTSDGLGAVVSPVPGEPILVYNPNATATTTVDQVKGYYGKY